MRTLSLLLENNRVWAEGITRKDPDFFKRLAVQQAPRYLWIGCSDSRVPATQLVGLSPGEMFVHRNVANLVVHTDLNCLSVMQYAVDVLKVKDIIVCGHYGCGGVQAALQHVKLGLIDNWLRNIQDVAEKYQSILAREPDEEKRLNKLCELNVLEQVANVCQTTVVQSAWERGSILNIHGWIYDLKDGRIKDLGICVTSQDEAMPMVQQSKVR